MSKLVSRPTVVLSLSGPHLSNSPVRWKMKWGKEMEEDAARSRIAVS